MTESKEVGFDLKDLRGKKGRQGRVLGKEESWGEATRPDARKSEWTGKRN